MPNGTRAVEKNRAWEEYGKNPQQEGGWLALRLEGKGEGGWLLDLGGKDGPCEG